jgi:hypothetical protein
MPLHTALPATTTLLLLVAGTLLMLWGRQLFWLAVAAVGAVLAGDLALRIPALAQGELRWLAPLLAAVAGALLAVFLQRVAIALTGFLGGAGAAWWSVTANLLPLSAEQDRLAVVALVLAAGALGAFLAGWLFTGALAVLSSLAGALLVVRAVAPGPPWDLALLLGVALFGVVIQLGRATGSGDR